MLVNIRSVQMKKSEPLMRCVKITPLEEHITPLKRNSA